MTVSLNLATHRNSPARSTKSTTSHSCGAMSARKHTVSGSLSLPSRGSFHRSLTVLYSIGHMVVFSLTRWSSLVPTGFLVSRRTLDPPSSRIVSSTGLLPSLAVLSNTLRLRFLMDYGVRHPANITTHGLGSSDFARHYLGNHCYFLFLQVLRCFSSLSSPHRTILFIRWYLHSRVSVFPHSDIHGSMFICNSP